MTPLDPQPRGGRVVHAAAAHRQAGHTGAQRGARIAVIARDESVRASICLLLGTAGHTAVGYALIEQFDPQPAEPRFDCLVIDADRTGSVGHTARVPAGLPIIVLAAEPDGTVWRAAGVTGPVYQLVKPVPPDELIDGVDQVLGARSRQMA